MKKSQSLFSIQIKNSTNKVALIFISRKVINIRGQKTRKKKIQKDFVLSIFWTS